MATADCNRPDLLSAGFKTSCHGFEFVIPMEFDEVTSVRAFIDNTDYELPASAPDHLIDPGFSRPLPETWRSGESTYRFPSFFILGAAKCGTTSLHGYLAAHPLICMSNPKEPFYFEAECSYGEKFYFNRYFWQWNDEQVVGEARHRNLYLPFVPPRIHAYNPDAKLIVLLRNPIERCVSHWWHWYSRGLDPLPFWKAVQDDFERIQSGSDLSTPEAAAMYARTLDAQGQGCFRTYLDSGYYYEQILRYTELFPVERLKIIFCDDFFRDPAATVREVLEFLNIDPDSSPLPDVTPHNVSKPGMFTGVDDRAITWLRSHYWRHNRKLEDWLERSLPWG
ncbi:MAG: sulfotransferase [Bryobacterales bacterium]|nr:sulfotransferase [Bryobacterales bacterium]